MSNEKNSKHQVRKTDILFTTQTSLTDTNDIQINSDMLKLKT